MQTPGVGPTLSAAQDSRVQEGLPRRPGALRFSRALFPCREIPPTELDSILTLSLITTCFSSPDHSDTYILVR